MTRSGRFQPNPDFEFETKKNPETMILQVKCLEITQIIQDWHNAKRKNAAVIQFNPVDAARLLKLFVWSEEYCIDVVEILDLLVPILKLKNVRTSRRRKTGLGFTVASITGLAAERILVMELAKMYPDQDNVEYWREAKREDDILREQELKQDTLPVKNKMKGGSLLHYSSVEEYNRLYDEYITKEREAFDKEYDQKWRRRKRYRSNPWI